ncbi:MAG: tRNA (guanine(46)-N(7))-methyltransferase TrmB [SAR324 cluster bacterium]
MPMPHTPDTAFRINPYTRWVYDHPERLLAEPTPDLLARARRLAAPASRLEVDLGCGSGNFLVQLAAAHSDRHYVGFELRYKRLVKSARKLERQGCANAWLLREAAERFGDYFAPASVDRVYVNFPDPWPRRSQWKKRLIGKAFLEELQRVLKPDGELRLKTDHSGYFLHALQLILDRPGWRLSQFANDLHRGIPRVQQCHGDTPRLIPQNVETEFEQLFLSKRQPVHFMAVQKVGRPHDPVLSH